MRIVAVFDYGDGRTGKGHPVADRYTIILSTRYYRRGTVDLLEYKNTYNCLGVSDDPTHPMGFSQFGSAYYSRLHSNAHLGEKIRFTKLPKHVQDHVKARLK